LWVVQERDTIAAVVIRAQDRTTRKQLGILQIAFCTYVKELGGMRPTMWTPGRLLDTLSPQCAYEEFLRHRKTLVSSLRSPLDKSRVYSGSSIKRGEFLASTNPLFRRKFFLLEKRSHNLV